MQAGERNKINHKLKQLGFGGLEDRNLYAQIATLYRTHDSFRGLLMSTAVDQRRVAYEALKPHLCFTPKSLSDYEMETKLKAEEEQWDVFDGTAYPKPFEVANITLEKKAEMAIDQESKATKTCGYLSMVCSYCLTQGTFVGETRKDAAKEAVKAGWRPRYKKADAEKKVVDSLCPKCVKARNVQANS